MKKLGNVENLKSDEEKWSKFFDLMKINEEIQKKLLETQKELEEAREDKFLIEFHAEELMQQVAAHLELGEFRESIADKDTTFMALYDFFQKFTEKFGYKGLIGNPDREVEVKFYRERYEANVDYKNYWKDKLDRQSEMFLGLYNEERGLNQLLFNENTSLRREREKHYIVRTSLERRLVRRIMEEDRTLGYQGVKVSILIKYQ